jgi:hypothetical protein
VRQQSINVLHHFTIINLIAMVQHLAIIEELPAVMGHMLSVDVVTPTNER